MKISCNHASVEEEGNWQPDQQRPGEIWVRWGCDGVPLWARSYLTLTVSLGSLGVRQPLHTRLKNSVVLTILEKKTHSKAHVSAKIIVP